MTENLPGEAGPSLECCCAFAEPWGFVPEAGCEAHDNNDFLAFVQYAIDWGRKRPTRAKESISGNVPG